MILKCQKNLSWKQKEEYFTWMCSFTVKFTHIKKGWYLSSRCFVIIIKFVYIYQESEKLMPILWIQYKTDLNMICLKMKGYQKLLREECIRKNNDKLEVIISK